MANNNVKLRIKQNQSIFKTWTIIAAVVAVDDIILGKPVDKEDARRKLP